MESGSWMRRVWRELRPMRSQLSWKDFFAPAAESAEGSGEFRATASEGWGAGWGAGRTVGQEAALLEGDREGRPGLGAQQRDLAVAAEPADQLPRLRVDICLPPIACISAESERGQR